VEHELFHEFHIYPTNGQLGSSCLYSGGAAGFLNVDASDSPFSLPLFSSRCANRSFSADKSFQACCVSFCLGVGSFEQYGTVLGGHPQQM